MKIQTAHTLAYITAFGLLACSVSANNGAIDTTEKKAGTEHKEFELYAHGEWQKSCSRPNGWKGGEDWKEDWKHKKEDWKHKKDHSKDREGSHSDAHRGKGHATNPHTAPANEETPVDGEKKGETGEDTKPAHQGTKDIPTPTTGEKGGEGSARDGAKDGAKDGTSDGTTDGIFPGDKPAQDPQGPFTSTPTVTLMVTQTVYETAVATPIGTNNDESDGYYPEEGAKRPDSPFSEDINPSNVTSGIDNPLEGAAHSVMSVPFTAMAGFLAISATLWNLV
ncbi:hypothetical protein BDF14DRAFT_1955295 [Spinellus fusiger]|nr:hypothetical protein BDF14DRAFT_1955295 [Spinellus fusiger]